ncbi:MAG: cytochrome c nitrite reductase small subunit [Deltaproteobacteria bacterium]|nr:cytochrome c nitrite reductase small subunit [Deltaproteobacteria bacterium]
MSLPSTPSGDRAKRWPGLRAYVGVGLLGLTITIALGVLLGVGVFTFTYGRGLSYLSSDPKACTNCHVMQDAYDTWVKSSHRNVAVCNDCHLPHDFVGKWLTKADNGLFHSLAFTFDDFHEPIQIKPRNRKVTQRTCIDCHGSVVHQMLPEVDGGSMLMCVHCHADVGHQGRRRTTVTPDFERDP